MIQVVFENSGLPAALHLQVNEQEVAVYETSLVMLQFLDVGVPGPPGSSGGGGASTRVDFSSSASWGYTHNLGRVPFVLAYLSDGSVILADITATNTTLTVVHASAVAGFVLFF